MVARNAFEADKPYLWNKFQAPVLDPATGLDNETIKRHVIALSQESERLPHAVVKAQAFAYVAGHVRIDVSPHDWFVGFGCWDRHDRLLRPLTAKWDHEVNVSRLTTVQCLQDQNRCGASRLGKDFDHSVPDWDALFSLGFPGIRERARQYRRRQEERGPLPPQAQAYFDSIEIAYSAMLTILERFRDHALSRAKGSERMLACAACLDTLRHGPPTNTYEVLHLVYLYFMFSEYMDCLQVRSLGNLDRTVYPYFAKDLKEGRHSEGQIREFFAYFLMQWASIANVYGHPFYLGGTDSDGGSEINDLSYLILDVFDQLDICSPKLQLKIAPNTPTAFIDKAVDMIRRGRSSIVFLCEPSIKRAMMGYGASEEEARTCDITGCYEFIPRARGNGTIPGTLNMLKPIELVFNNGIDPHTDIDCGCGTGGLETLRTFDDFYSAYLKQLDNTIESIILCVNDFEKHLGSINPTPIYSATIESSLATARDAFHDGCVHNLSSIPATGFATAVDALMAVKEQVYERGALSLRQFKEILAADWQGHERLRQKVLHGRNKFGNGIDAVDVYAEALAGHLASQINRRPNSRGGLYMASMHSPPPTYVTFGEKTGATPDGRAAGEQLSRNMSPTMGMDTHGVTGLIRSATRIDSAAHPGDFPLDVMLHPATVQGDEGLAAVRTLLSTYMERHGIAIQFNVFDAGTLRDAQAHPDRYQGLQVRVCGWNLHFNDLCREEQNLFIKRAQNLSG